MTRYIPSVDPVVQQHTLANGEARFEYAKQRALFDEHIYETRALACYVQIPRQKTFETLPVGSLLHCSLCYGSDRKGQGEEGLSASAGVNNNIASQHRDGERERR